MDLVAAGAYIAKVGGPKIATAVSNKIKHGGWARRAARKSFAGVSRPHPVEATAAWLKRPETLTDVLLLPDAPQGSAVESLDRFLCEHARRRWTKLDVTERRARLEQVLGGIYNAVLMEHDPRWATMVSGQRVLAATQRTQQKVDALTERADKVLETRSEDEVSARIAQLPAPFRTSALVRWRDDKTEVWKVVAALTAVDATPAEVLRQWQASTPQWLVTAATPARLVAADLAWAYGVPRLGATLYESAARDGAPRAANCVARAALLLNDDGDPDEARRVLAGWDQGPADGMVDCVRAAVAEDWRALRAALDAWTPADSMEEAVKYALRSRDVLSRGDDGLVPPGAFDELIRLGRAVAAAAEAPSVLLNLARFLVLRVKQGGSDDPYSDLTEARELAIRVRDERRGWRAPTADAAAVACEAALLAGDVGGVISLGDDGDGSATAAEAADPSVRQFVILARALRGEPVADVEQGDAATPYMRARLRATIAERQGSDAIRLWKEALDAATEDDERAVALVGLARSGADELPGLDELALVHPDVAREIRAISDLAHGRNGPAIAALRTLAKTSPSAAIALAEAYRKAGDMSAEVDTLRAAAADFHDPQYRFHAAIVLARAGGISQARQEIRDVLASAPTAWPGLADAQRLGAELALDDGDVLAAEGLLRAALTTEPDDTRTRWGLVRLLLARSDYPAAWRAYNEHPTTLDPVTELDARAWIEIHREHASGEVTVRGCLRLMRQFADSEEIRAAALAAVIAPGSRRDPIPADLLAEYHQAINDFTTTWPESKHFFVMTVPDDPSDLMAMMDDVVRVSPEQQHARRELATKIVLGNLPLGMLASAMHHSYAEVVLRRGIDVIPARHPDPDEHAVSVDTARRLRDTNVVVDTTALVVTALLPRTVITAARGAFRLTTLDDVLADARAANASLSAQSPGRLVWDEESQRSWFVESDEHLAARLAEAAKALIEDIQQVRRVPRRPSTDERLESAELTPWLPLIELGKADGAALWSDDASMRVLARSMGVESFSTLAVLDLLEESGNLTSESRAEIDRVLLMNGVGDLPLLSKRDLLMSVAEEEQWRPGSVAVALSRPGMWIDPRRTVRETQLLLGAVVANAPQTVPGWMYRFTRGVAYAHLHQPETAHLAVAPILSTIALLSGAQGPSAAALVDAARTALRETGYFETGALDPVVPAAQLLYNALSTALPRQTAGQYVLGFAATLDPEDRDGIARMVLTVE